MSRENESLIITAHPDDETIFFGGLVLSRPDTSWHVVCATDGNADKNGAQRAIDFQNACTTLGVKKTTLLSFEDKFNQRLPLDLLSQKLSHYLDTCSEVFTHGVLGEYGHPHHQDVSLAVHQTFSSHSVYSVAHNCYPDLLISMDQESWSLKAKILANIYKSETQRFFHLLPCGFCEGFTKVSLLEVETIYNFLTDKTKQLDTSKLNAFAHLDSHINHLKNLERPF